MAWASSCEIPHDSGKYVEIKDVTKEDLLISNKVRNSKLKEA